MLTKRHDEIQLIRTLEGELQRNDEGVVDQSENGSFGQNMGDLSRARGEHFLADGFESVDSRCVLLADLHHLLGLNDGED